MILQRHPFVQERFAAATEALRVDDSDVLDSLTEPLSESREFTKQNVGPKSYFFFISLWKKSWISQIYPWNDPGSITCGVPWEQGAGQGDAAPGEGKATRGRIADSHQVGNEENIHEKFRIYPSDVTTIHMNDSGKFPRSRHVINEWGPNSLQITKPRLIEQACKYFVVVWLILEREKVKISWTSTRMLSKLFYIICQYCR